MTEHRALPPRRYWRKRELVLMLIALSLALFAAYGGDVPGDRILYAAGRALVEDGKGAPEAPRSVPAAPSRLPPLDCQRRHNGQWLRGGIKHDGDSMRWSQCWYDTVQREEQ